MPTSSRPPLIRAALELLRQTYETWRTDGAPQIAAALTYYVLLSLAPLLVLLVGVLGRYVGQAIVADRLLVQASALGGPAGEKVVAELVAAAAPSAAGIAGSVVAVLVAFSGAMQMFRQLRIAFDRMWEIPAETSPGGNAWQQVKWSLSALGKTNLVAFLIVLAVGALLVASLVLSSVVSVAADRIAPLLAIGQSALRGLDTILAMALVTALSAVVYRYLPRVSVGWRDVWVGAIMTAALFTLGRALLGVYFAYASPGSAYGAAGSVVALLVWVNLSLQIMLFGAEFTHVWAFAYGSRASRS